MDVSVKMQIMREIQDNVDVFIPVPPIRYRIRCPFCGDSDKNPKDAHLYIKCSNDPNEPLLYNCFLANCGAKGKIDKRFMDMLKIKSQFNDELQNQRYNKINMINNASIDILTGYPKMDSPQTRYIESRLGEGFTVEDYDRFKIIWDMDEVRKYITDSKTLNTLPNNVNRITFLSDNKSMLISRSFVEGSKESQWRKIYITKNSDKTFYVIKSTLDLFTSETITVNIAEGILDILSVYKNFNDGQNSVFIAALGPNYISALDYVIAKGFIGKNIDIKIYIDSNIKPKNLIYGLKKYRWLFNSIKIFRNIMYEDVGTRIEKIRLMEVTQ